MAPNPRDLSVLALATCVTLWGSAFVGIRDLSDTFSPGALSLGRLIVGAIALTVIAWPKHQSLPTGRALFYVALYGVVWFGVYNISLNAGERYLDAGTASLVVNTGTIFIAVFAGIFFQEGFPKPLLLGTAVAFAGVGLIALGAHQNTSAVTTTSLAGVLLCIVAAISYAIGVLAQKPALKTVPAVQAVWLGCIIGAVVCLPYGPSLIDQGRAASAKDILVLVYLGVFPTAIGYSAWSYALKRIDAGRAAATTYLVPAVAILMGWVFLNEAPTTLALAGGALSLVGVAITRVKRRARVAGPVPG